MWRIVFLSIKYLYSCCSKQEYSGIHKPFDCDQSTNIFNLLLRIYPSIFSLRRRVLFCLCMWCIAFLSTKKKLYSCYSEQHYNGIHKPFDCDQCTDIFNLLLRIYPSIFSLRRRVLFCLCMWCIAFLSTKKNYILATVNNITTEYTNLLIVINAQTFLTSCSEFILPFLILYHVSYFVCFYMRWNVFLPTKKVYSCYSKQE